jgi:hypothetical protein
MGCNAWKQSVKRRSPRSEFDTKRLLCIMGARHPLGRVSPGLWSDDLVRQGRLKRDACSTKETNSKQPRRPPNGEQLPIPCSSHAARVREVWGTCEAVSRVPALWALSGPTGHPDRRELAIGSAQRAEFGKGCLRLPRISCRSGPRSRPSEDGMLLDRHEAGLCGGPPLFRVWRLSGTGE